MKLQFAMLPAALIGVLVAACSGVAQERRGAVDLSLIDDRLHAQRQQVTDAMEQWREVRKRYLALRIDELKRVCQLSEKQVRKLEVAAKGAVEESLGDWHEMLQVVQAAELLENRAIEQAVGQQILAAPDFQIQLGEQQARQLAVPLLEFQKQQMLRELEVRGALERRARQLEVGGRQEKAAALRVEADGVQAEAAARRAAVDQKPAPVPAPAAPAQRIDAVDDARVRLLLEDGRVLQGGVRAALPGGINAPAIRVWNARSARAPNADPASVADQPRWKETVERTLTDEQKTAYHQAIQQRQSFQRRAAAETVVAMIDEEILLSSPQREELTKLVDEHAGDEIAATLRTRGMSLGNAMLLLRDLPEASMQAVLSESQQAKWEELRAGGPAAVGYGGRRGANPYNDPYNDPRTRRIERRR